MNSSEWFGKIPNTSLFSHLNIMKHTTTQYAEILQMFSQACKFAYSNRLSAMQVSLDPAQVNTLGISFLEVDTSA